LTVFRANASGDRLDVWLAKESGFSRSLIQRQIKNGSVLVNGLPAKSNYLIQPGDAIVLDEADAEEGGHVPAPDLPVIYEDKDIMVIDKPAGIAVHSGNGLIEQVTVADFARHHTTDTDKDRPGIVHRLDKDTSGLLVLAKSEAAKEYLQQQWRNRAVAKTYLLLATGRVKPDQAVIKLPIGRAAGRPTLRAVTPGGKPAVTGYRLLATYPGYSYIEAHPETGRTHQLRVHFAAIGHPIAGDVQYGAAARPLGLTRQFLHASSLSFKAPSGRQLTLTSELPADLREALRLLENQV